MSETNEASPASETSDVERIVRFLYRDHRGMLADSMTTVRELHSKEELIQYLKRGVTGVVDCSKITIKKYGNGIDKRIGWDTHIVTLDGYGVFGFTDRAVET